LGCAIFFQKFLNKVLKLSIYTSNIFVLFLISNYVYSLFLITNPFLVDPLNNLFWMMAIYYLFRDQYFVFTAILLIGCINKEVILFLAPLYPLFMLIKYGGIRNRHFWKSVICLVGIGAFYVGYRKVIENFIRPDGYEMFTTAGMSKIETVVDALTSKSQKFWIIFDTFKFLWLFFFLFLWELCREFGWKNRYLACSLYLFVILFLGRMFAVDANRVYVMLAPMVMGMSALFCTSNRLNFNRWLTILLFAHMALNVSENPLSMEWQILFNCALAGAILFQKRENALSELNEATLLELKRL